MTHGWIDLPAQNVVQCYDPRTLWDNRTGIVNWKIPDVMLLCTHGANIPMIVW